MVGCGHWDILDNRGCGHLCDVHLDCEELDKNNLRSAKHGNKSSDCDHLDILGCHIPGT